MGKIKLGGDEARRIIQQEIESLARTTGELGISKAVLSVKDEMAPAASEGAQARPMPDAIRAQWSAFTERLGDYLVLAEKNALDLGGKDGIADRKKDVDHARAALEVILSPASTMALKPDVALAIAVCRSGQYIPKAVLSPEALAAMNVLIAPHAAKLDYSIFESVYRKGGRLDQLFVDPPLPLPPIGDHTFSSYLRELAQQIEDGKIALMKKDEMSFGPDPMPKEIASDLRRNANARDPGYKKPRFGGADEPRGMDGDTTFIALRLNSQDPVGVWLRDLSHAHTIAGQQR
ncbi:MAG: hypothetical protein IT384_26335 [Deltaproteobacteria bacterium]|nr:hypothetical protein [Deltaproteobacteria bacterium]